MVSANLLGCSTARNKGTCDNRTNIRRDQLEERVLNALRHHLMDPALFAEFCDEFTREMNRLRLKGRTSINSAEAEIKKIDRDLDMLVELILKGGQADRLNEKRLVLEKRQKALKEFLGTAEVPPPLLHPEMAYYRDRVGELYAALKSEPQNQQMAVTEALRALVEKIILTPEKGVLQIDVRGDLAGILNISLERKNPPKRRVRWWLGPPVFSTCGNRKLRWLRELKRKYDPDNVFRGNFNVTPAD